jgi:alpha-glucosidase
MAITPSSQPHDTGRSAVPQFKLAGQRDNRFRLESEGGHVALIEVLEDDIIRVQVLPHGVLKSPRTWAIAPGLSDVPAPGFEKDALPGFTRPACAPTVDGQTLALETARIRLEVELEGFRCHWYLRRPEGWVEAMHDRPTQGYNFDYWDARVYHYLARREEEQYFGLGEKTGDADRHGNSYRMCNLDAAFYNAKTSDPLYKHIPFYLTHHTDNELVHGLFYDTYADCRFDFGRELDNYHGFYRSFVAESGDLDYYFIAGDTVRDVVARFTWLTGRPAFPPRWSLGYSGSTMTYTEAPNAQERMNDFLANCGKHDMLCDSFHLSSGYTTIDGRRYVFNWDTSKFPDAKAFTRHYLDHHVRIVANVKPALLTSHPRYREASDLDALIRNPDGSPFNVVFWGGNAAYVDFTAKAGYDWWKNGIKSALLDYGITSAWNDNNEFEVWDPRALAENFGNPIPATEIRPLQTLLMCKASFEAQQDHAPQKRPFTVSRAGFAGMQRYVQTWSGDNCTSWQTLKYNVRMGTGLAMSGVSNSGHDVGGFLGPQPDPELFLRWLQFGVFLPRFSIHSDKAGGGVTEPWMYPEILPLVRELFRLRYRLMPYYYDLLWHSHSSYQPVMRPTYYTFPHDARCYAENDDMMIGENLLVAAVVEKGASTREIYLPAGARWVLYGTNETFDGGSTVTLPAPHNMPMLLVREGCGLPINVAEQHFDARSDERGFLLYPAIEGAFSVRSFEDDGESFCYREGRCGEWRVEVSATAEAIAIDLGFEGDRSFASQKLELLLPARECREVRLSGARVQSDKTVGLHRVVRVELQFAA